MTASVPPQPSVAVRSVFTIPSSDAAFAKFVASIRVRDASSTAAEFERRLRTIFPRVVVRERSLSGEDPSWYVYRDGGWRPDATGPWWLESGLPRIVVSSDGWVVDATRTAIDLLGVARGSELPHHFTDFVVAGGLDDALALFEVVNAGDELESTILLRPASGDVIAVDVHAMRDGDRIAASIRLADNVDIPIGAEEVVERPKIRLVPATDVAFRAYAERALERMPEPTVTGLELRLRRLYPHASVVLEDDGWTVHRDRPGSSGVDTQWWLDPGVARVRYDAQALILEANDAATELFARNLVGHHWQEFVTPGSTEQVTVMLEILAEVGAAESRFRMPLPDGSLLEFDSYTEVVGDELTTAFRTVPGSIRS